MLNRDRDKSMLIFFAIQKQDNSTSLTYRSDLSVVLGNRKNTDGATELRTNRKMTLKWVIKDENMQEVWEGHNKTDFSLTLVLKVQNDNNEVIPPFIILPCLFTNSLLMGKT